VLASMSGDATAARALATACRATVSAGGLRSVDLDDRATRHPPTPRATVRGRWIGGMTAIAGRFSSPRRITEPLPKFLSIGRGPSRGPSRDPVLQPLRAPSAWVVVPICDGPRSATDRKRRRSASVATLERLDSTSNSRSNESTDTPMPIACDHQAIGRPDARRLAARGSAGDTREGASRVGVSRWAQTARQTILGGLAVGERLVDGARAEGGHTMSAAKERSVDRPEPLLHPAPELVRRISVSVGGTTVRWQPTPAASRTSQHLEPSRPVTGMGPPSARQRADAGVERSPVAWPRHQTARARSSDRPPAVLDASRLDRAETTSCPSSPCSPTTPSCRAAGTAARPARRHAR